MEPGRWRAATDRYSSLTAHHGLFATDLTVLPDGRWAVQYAGSGPHVVGPRELQLALRSAGWQGEDLMLLATYPSTIAPGLRDHGRRLADDLRAEVWVLPPEADFTVVVGAVQVVDRQGRPLAWECLASGGAARWRSVAGILLPASDGLFGPDAPGSSATDSAVERGRPG